MPSNINLVGDEFRVIEVSNLLPGHSDAGAYSFIDRTQHVIWISRQTPSAIRGAVLSRARHLASSIRQLSIQAVD